MIDRFRWLKQSNWIARASGEVPWAPIRYFNAVGEEHGNQAILFVSRHDLAECGLVCPRCKAQVAERGDFTSVRKTSINGTENEVIRCPGTIIIEELDHPCGLWLAASPDTEHGDHLNDDGTVNTDGSNDSPEFFRFKRISAEQALREKYGADVVTGHMGPEISPTEHVPIAAPVLTNKHDVLTGEDLQLAIQKARAELESKGGMLPAEVVKTFMASPPLDPDATPVTGAPHSLPKDGPHV
jgi:hypothetical protein